MQQKQFANNLYETAPFKTTFKFLLPLFIVAICYTIIGFNFNIALTMASIFVAGVMYAHMVELQHECLHESAFKSRKINRIFGVIFGTFTFNSYSAYKHEHILHHQNLGTHNNTDYVYYENKPLNSITKFLKVMFYIGRFKTEFYNMFFAITGKEIPDLPKGRWQKKARLEYLIMLFCFTISLIFTIFTGNLFFILAWYIPAVLIAEPITFLLELPEHYGLELYSNSNVFENTRSIKTSFLFSWIANKNNLHTAHHYAPYIPMHNLNIIHKQNKHLFKVNESSYFSFYKKVVKGEIVQN